MKISAKIVAAMCVQPTYTTNLAAEQETPVAGTFILIFSLLCSLPPSYFLLCCLESATSSEEPTASV